MKKNVINVVCMILILTLLTACSITSTNSTSEKIEPTMSNQLSEADIIHEPTLENTPEPTLDIADAIIGEVVQLNGMALQVTKIENLKAAVHMISRKRGKSMSSYM